MINGSGGTSFGSWAAKASSPLEGEGWTPISPAPITNDSQPSAPASEPEQPVLQDPPAAQVLDLNDHAEDD